MSRYVILSKYAEPLHLGGDRYSYYSMYYHTYTKYEDNKPYWSMYINQAERFSISKEDLPAKLKEAQMELVHRRKQQTRKSKRDKVFVLKLNSPKLKEIQKT